MAMNGRPDRNRPALAAIVLALGVVTAACSGAGLTSSPGASAPPPSPNPVASPTPVTSPISGADAVARVLALQPRFAGIGPLDPNMIGQSAWYEVSPGTVGWRVIVTVGWGDCQAGCISRHSWTYDVDPDGTVRLSAENGDPLADGGVPSSPPVAIPADGGPWIAGRALAGPVCPVVRNPPDPACADRPVAGAGVLVRDASSAIVARATTAADGTFLVAVPRAGSYAVEAQPVPGLMRTPAATTVTVPDGPAAWAVVDLSYDTGIR